MAQRQASAPSWGTSMSGAGGTAPWWGETGSVRWSGRRRGLSQAGRSR